MPPLPEQRAHTPRVGSNEQHRLSVREIIEELRRNDLSIPPRPADNNERVGTDHFFAQPLGVEPAEPLDQSLLPALGVLHEIPIALSSTSEPEDKPWPRRPQPICIDPANSLDEQG